MKNHSTRWVLMTSLAVWGCSPASSGDGATTTANTAPLTKAPVNSTEELGASDDFRGEHDTRTPIKHVIIIIGENRTFDQKFATYKPKHRQRVTNLLSEGMIDEAGNPGPNFDRARQMTAVDSAADGYQVSPGAKAPYARLPPPLAGGPTSPFISTVATAKQAQAGLPDNYYTFLTTGGTGLASGALDTRIANVNNLPPGPFQLTPGVGYDDYAASPVHRFYQMWQQLDCNVKFATLWNPSGCKQDLFPWVEVTIGAGNNGDAQPSNFNDASTGEGSISMGFYNVLQGDAPYLKYLADTYSMSDNYHQAVQGGTGANHVALGSGDAIWFSDGHGKPVAPPTLNTENPNAQTGTNNWYTQDGYSGGSYSDCADPGQPGASSVISYLSSLPRSVNPNCETGHYYLLNNYAPGYFGDGSVNSDPLAIPPSPLRTIGDELLEHDISVGILRRPIQPVLGRSSLQRSRQMFTATSATRFNT